CRSGTLYEDGTAAPLPLATALASRQQFSGFRPMNRSTNVWRIEDDPNLGPATLELLAAQGHAALLADSYEQAFAILTGTHRIEVLILDLQLGLRRGDELVASLRTHGARVPPIVVFSA